MYHLIYECHITGVFCIPFTYVLLGNKYLFIVIVIVKLRIFMYEHERECPGSTFIASNDECIF